MTVTVPVDSSHYSCVAVLVVYHASKQQPSSLYWLPDTSWNMFFLFLSEQQWKTEEKRKKKTELGKSVRLSEKTVVPRAAHCPFRHTAYIVPRLFFCLFPPPPQQYTWLFCLVCGSLPCDPQLFLCGRAATLWPENRRSHVIFNSSSSAVTVSSRWSEMVKLQRLNGTVKAGRV